MKCFLQNKCLSNKHFSKHLAFWTEVLVHYQKSVFQCTLSMFQWEGKHRFQAIKEAQSAKGAGAPSHLWDTNPTELLQQRAPLPATGTFPPSTSPSPPPPTSCVVSTFLGTEELLQKAFTFICLGSTQDDSQAKKSFSQNFSQDGFECWSNFMGRYQAIMF